MIFKSVLGVVMACLVTIQNESHKLNFFMSRKKDVAQTYVYTSKPGRCDVQPMITVFIHGTRIFPKFHAQELYYSPEGLWPVKDIEEKSHMHTIARTLSEKDPSRFNYDLFYAFGWNGNLNFDERKKEARKLHDSLAQLVSAYEKEHGCKPQIRLITHSHGGNVALNLAGLPEIRKSNLFIDELILLAVPVQKETKDFISSPIFGKIWSFSSNFDLIQLIDPQGLHNGIGHGPFFSQRYFVPVKNLIQSRVILNSRSIFHIEFFLRKFLNALPSLMDALDDWAMQDEDAWQKVPCVTVVDNKLYIQV